MAKKKYNNTIMLKLILTVALSSIFLLTCWFITKKFENDRLRTITMIIDKDDMYYMNDIVFNNNNSLCMMNINILKLNGNRKNDNIKKITVFLYNVDYIDNINEEFKEYQQSEDKERAMFYSEYEITSNDYDIIKEDYLFTSDNYSNWFNCTTKYLINGKTLTSSFKNTYEKSKLGYAMITYYNDGTHSDLEILQPFVASWH